MTTPRRPADDSLRAAAADLREDLGAAAEEVRHEARVAAGELQAELAAARRETRAALREAMAEVGAALRGITGSATSPESASAAGPRMSRRERKELTRELLLDAAIEVFARKGYNGASLDDVADAAGFTKGAVYSNFSRKSDLFVALLLRETARRQEAFSEAVAGRPLTELPETGGRWLEHREEDDRDVDLFTMESWLAAARDPDIAALLRHSRHTVLDDLGRGVDEQVAAAAARPGLSGSEIVLLLEALGTGLLMAQALEPGVVPATLFSRAIRKLLADEYDAGPTEPRG